MRIALSVGVFATALVIATPLVAAEMSPSVHAQAAGHGKVNVYAAGACAAPGFGTQSLEPGCCQCQPNCCDDVWAGYCQNKHKGLAVPCLRPIRPRCTATVAGPTCSPGCKAHGAGYPVTGTVRQQPMPAVEVDALPTPAPTVQPLPSIPEEAPPLKPESKSPSDAVGLPPIPMFNPAAWKIGASAK